MDSQQGHMLCVHVNIQKMSLFVQNIARERLP